MAAANNQSNKATIAGIGDALREAREKKSLTIDQVQRHTHIHSTVIKALEEGRCDDILNPTYVKSFLKKYSDHLGLDSRQILDQYRTLCQGSTRPEERRPVRTTAPENESGLGMSVLLAVFKFIVIAAVAVSLVVFVGAKIKAHFKEPTLARAAVTSKAALSQAKAKKNADKAVSSRISIPKNVPLKLLLKVKERVFVKLKTDRNLLFERVLEKGTAEEFTAENVINIYVAKGEAIELILNGKFLGSPGAGLMKNVEITRSGVRLK